VALDSVKLYNNFARLMGGGYNSPFTASAMNSRGSAIFAEFENAQSDGDQPQKALVDTMFRRTAFPRLQRPPSRSRMTG
jgi:hypothetical protein